MSDPTRRFSNRVADYVRWRPSYPPQIVDLLRDECGLTSAWAIADIGSGPGNLTRLFLDNGNAVFGVEPNLEMRAAGERLLAAHPGFTSIDGSAEETGLPGASVDLVVAGQAFHWFDVERSRRELGRILRGARWVALIWNERKVDGSPFLVAYEELLRSLGTDYAEVRHGSQQGAALTTFFGGADRYATASFPYEQRFDLEGLQGRVMSSSYVPVAGQAGHDEVLAELATVFEHTNKNGEVTFAYDSTVYCGRL